MTDTELTTNHEHSMVPATPNMRPMELIQFAIEKDLDTDKMERLFALAERYADRDAESAYASAMRDCQASITPIVRRHENTQTRSTYAKLEDVDKVIRPIYTKHGFAVSFGTEDSPHGTGYIRIIADVFHIGGHTRRYHADLAVDDKGPQGKANKTLLHGAGSTFSYGRRYVTAMIFNVVFAAEDNDGNHDKEKVSEEQAANIRALVDEVGGEPAMLKWCGAERIAAIEAWRYPRVIETLEAKR